MIRPRSSLVIRATILLLALSVCGCGPAPRADAPARQQHLAQAPAAGSDEELARARTRDALLAASGEARAPVDAAADAATPNVGLLVTPALAEILPNERRSPRNGGSAVLVLADPASPVGAAKNLALCRAVFETADAANAGPAPDAARPIYWLALVAADFSDASAERCVSRLAAYDYPRAERVQRKLGLSGAGPFLIAERHDLLEASRIAAVIDLARTPPEQVGAAVRYFRDRLLPADTLWAPESFAAETTRPAIAAFLAEGQTDLPFTPRLVRSTRRSACALSDLTDSCAAPG